MTADRPLHYVAEDSELMAALLTDVSDTVRLLAQRTENIVRATIAAEIARFADDDSDVSDAYRHAALIATQGATE